MKRIVYLTGFMGAGKSTIGPILANTLGWDYCDLDRIIEEETGKTIRDIFNQSGESGFRVIESNKLSEISSGDFIVVSLGGGTICFPGNLDIMKNTGYIVYLKTSLEAISKRLIFKNDRPLINTLESTSADVLNSVKTLFELRKPFYEQADLIVDTENNMIGKTVDYLAKKILNHLKVN